MNQSVANERIEELIRAAIYQSEQQTTLALHERIDTIMAQLENLGCMGIYIVRITPEQARDIGLPWKIAQEAIKEAQRLRPQVIPPADSYG